MTLPIAAIVGRPNVGKSSILNALCGKRVSIVEPTPGVTRDRVSVEIAIDDAAFELVDTGGIGLAESDDFAVEVNRQISIAMDVAAVIVFVCDTRAGVTALDVSAADMVRRRGKPVIVAANKSDDPSMDAHALDFLRLGLGNPLPVSALHHRNTGPLLDAIAGILKPFAAAKEPDPVMKIAVVGRRNAGKSTLINALAGEERVIVSEIPGTTRDSVDIRFERGGKTFLAIDTAGLRKKSSIGDSIEFYSRVRAEESIRRCDVVLLMIDATEKIGRIDKQIADYVVRHHRGCIIVLNKWDLVPQGYESDEFVKYARKALAVVPFAPLSFISAKEASNVGETVDLALDLFGQMTTRVSTADLNKAVEAAQTAKRPPMKGGRQPKIYFATQTEVNPPTMVLFANYPELFRDDYCRYLQNRLRDSLPISEVPIRFVFRAKS